MQETGDILKQSDVVSPEDFLIIIEFHCTGSVPMSPNCCWQFTVDVLIS